MLYSLRACSSPLTASSRISPTSSFSQSPTMASSSNVPSSFVVCCFKMAMSCADAPGVLPSGCHITPIPVSPSRAELIAASSFEVCVAASASPWAASSGVAVSPVAQSSVWPPCAISPGVCTYSTPSGPISPPRLPRTDMNPLPPAPAVPALRTVAMAITPISCSFSGVNISVSGAYVTLAATSPST